MRWRDIAVSSPSKGWWCLDFMDTLLCHYPTLETLLDSYERISFQANSLGKAINIVNKMVGAPFSLVNVYIDC